MGGTLCSQWQGQATPSFHPRIPFIQLEVGFTLPIGHRGGFPFRPQTTPYLKQYGRVLNGTYTPDPSGGGLHLAHRTFIAVGLLFILSLCFKQCTIWFCIGAGLPR